jgi:hypothetical protein
MRVTGSSSASKIAQDISLATSLIALTVWESLANVISARGLS